MNQITTQAVILRRTDYGEADRILTLLTPDHGKLSLIAKGVRRVKSKLAGGIELFSVSDISYIKGRSDIGTLVSTRLVKHYGSIVKDVNRTMLGYDLIKQLHHATEEVTDSEYFNLIVEAFAALDDPVIDMAVIRLWFLMQLLRLDGHTPNLQNDTTGARLSADQAYSFDFDDMAFEARADAPFTASLIKFMRLGFAGNTPAVMQKVTGVAGLTAAVMPLVQTMAGTYIRS